MARVLADLPDDDIAWLDTRAAEQGKSRAALLREAVQSYMAQTKDADQDWIARGAGYWADRTDIADGVEYQRALRADRTSIEDF